MRCPACGATNPETAQWCGQCYHRFGDERAAAVAPRHEEEEQRAPVPSSPPVLDAQDVVQTEAPAAPPPATDGLRREGDTLLWTCPQCDHANPIELARCEVCGAAFIDRYRSEEPQPPRNWGAALAMTALAPGAGHIAVGAYGSGVARLVLFVGCVMGAVATAGFAGGRAALVVTPLVLGALVLWAGSIIDVYRAQQGERELLGGRSLLWLVVAVLVFMGLALFGALGARGT